MAVASDTPFCTLKRFSLTTADAGALATFYQKAFGCRRIADTRLRGQAFRSLMDVDCDARSVTLTLGNEVIELLEFDISGAPYPANSVASSIVFQHFSIVADEMSAAWLRLLRTNGWSSITAGCPQRLPDRAGGVTAFKFRDPEGHPLELLTFPRDQTPLKWSIANQNQSFLGIDHSAISVSDTGSSVEFYKAHGLTTSSRSHNAGVEQDQLDGLVGVAVDVTALTATISTPHVELLCYEKCVSRAPLQLSSNDIAATRLVFASGSAAMAERLTDPDGHHLTILPQSDLLRPA
jgi:catechol 2,3-dioxygenase-like lactoylglutathione lyase family enzyme